MPQTQSGDVGTLRPFTGATVRAAGPWREPEHVSAGYSRSRVLVSAWPRTFTPAGKTPSTAAAQLSLEDASLRWGGLSGPASQLPGSASLGSLSLGGGPVTSVIHLTGFVPSVQEDRGLETRKSRRDRPSLAGLFMSRTERAPATAGTTRSVVSWSSTLHPGPVAFQRRYAHSEGWGHLPLWTDHGEKWISVRECIFRSNQMLTAEVNPRLQDAWKRDGRKGYFPFAASASAWRSEHCPQVNPGRDYCPYSRDECTLAYYGAMMRTLNAHPDNFIAFARSVAKTTGLDRADNKPLARDRVNRERTSGHPVREQGLRGSPREGSVDDLAKPAWIRLGELADDARAGVYRPSGFTRVGELLGTDNIRSRSPARGRNEGEASADNAGDAGIGVPGPHGGWPEGRLPVEYGPQEGDQDLPGESE